jgi:hypothetical protein
LIYRVVSIFVVFATGRIDDLAALVSVGRLPIKLLYAFHDQKEKMSVWTLHLKSHNAWFLAVAQEKAGVTTS